MASEETFSINGLDFTIHSFQSHILVNDRKNVENEALELVKNGKVDAIIRDAMQIQGIKDLGVIIATLKSNEDAVRKAIVEAGRIFDIVKAEEGKRKEIITLVEQLDKGLITVDRENIIKMSNSTASRLLGKSRDHIDGTNIMNHLPLSASKEVAEKGYAVFNYNGVNLAIKNISIMVEGNLESSVLILEKVNDIIEQERSYRMSLYEKQGWTAHYNFDDIQGNSSAIRELKNEAKRYAVTDEVILIMGETGTGKELFAQSSHNASRRSQSPFISINCASFNENLLESELFGYEQGAFTGALKGGREGLFEMAHQGTLFLDEISKTTLNFQATLLRVLQEKRIRRVGGRRFSPVDVRIICATNRDLREEVSKGTFLEDLYFRIGVLKLSIPPLRERRDDISALVRFFIETEMRAGYSLKEWENRGIQKMLMAYPWPGNTRQLFNFIKRVLINCEGNKLTQTLVERYLAQEFAKRSEETLTIKTAGTLEEMERQLYEGLCKLYGGNKIRLCRDYNIGRTTLWRKLSGK
jgi:transcriptional regulator with PAS, ATPase and Fis domain